MLANATATAMPEITRLLKMVSIEIYSFCTMCYEECSDSDSGRVLDSRSRGCEFEPYRRHCVVSVSKTLYPLLSAGSTQEGLS